MTTSTDVSLDAEAGRRGRAAVTELLAEFMRARATTGMSQRAFAEAEGVPRTTLQHWLSRRMALELPAEAVAFFEGPAGLDFLHRLVVAAHLTMTWMGTCGIRMVGRFIEFAGLGEVLASSYGAHQQTSVEMQRALVEFGERERERLGSAMPHREITVAADETFLSTGVCLVAIEPVSGFVLVEEYAEKRDAETWNTVMREATKDLKVDVVQSTADEGKALARHAGDWDAHHSPDLFHVQHEVNQAFSLPLLRRRRRAQDAFDDAGATVERHVGERDAYRGRPRGPGRPPDFDGRIRAAECAQTAALTALDAEEELRQRWLDAMHGLALVYHPYDLDTGASRSAEKLNTELNAGFDELRAIAATAELSRESKAGIEKAARVVPKRVQTLQFFHDTVDERIEALALPEAIEELVRTVLVPAAYVSRAIDRADEASQRAHLRERLDRLLRPVRDPDGPLAEYDEAGLLGLERTAFALADIFQRSSSCVEGRNGRLSQWEHTLRRMSPKKLAGLTVVHNYLIKRPDETTAAERFFGSKPSDLFTWLLDRVRTPPRPASRRPNSARRLLVRPT